MTPQKENEAISVWAGLECRCVKRKDTAGHDLVWVDWTCCPRHSNGGLPPDYDRDEVAVGLLPILAKQGHQPTLSYEECYVEMWSCRIWNYECENKPTIAAAIKAAIKKMLERKAS